MAYNQGFGGEAVKTPQQLSIEAYHKHMAIFENVEVAKDPNLFQALVQLTESRFYNLLQGSGYKEVNAKIIQVGKEKKNCFATASERLKAIVLEAQKQGYYGENKQLQENREVLPEG
jgi:hypothetical protein